MTVTRLAVSFDKRLARAVRKAAGSQTTSSWLADAAAQKLRSEGLLETVSEWEAKHGALTASEVESARRQFARRRRK
jgi:hypothetical protein